MLNNKKLFLGLCLFIVGAIAAALFAIANSLSYLAFTTAVISNARNHTICGIFCLVFIIVAIVGIGMVISDCVKKK